MNKIISMTRLICASVLLLGYVVLDHERILARRRRLYQGKRIAQ
jgi:hypothetical protein